MTRTLSRPIVATGPSSLARRRASLWRAVILPLLALALPASAQVQAELTIGEQTGDFVLLGLRNGRLSCRPAHLPEGVEKEISADAVEEAHFDIQVDRIAVRDALRRGDWARAAAVLLTPCAKTLPFLSLPGNDAVEPVHAAGIYLMRAGESALTEEERVTQYRRARVLFTRLVEARWHFYGEVAALRAIQCTVELDELEEARLAIAKLREPKVGDGAHGLYWLVQGQLAAAGEDAVLACNAFSKTVTFDSKDPAVFAEALYGFARAHETLYREALAIPPDDETAAAKRRQGFNEVFRARDLYFECARLFPNRPSGQRALSDLRRLMDSGALDAKEQKDVSKVFFGMEEDMNATVAEFLAEREPPVEDEPGEDE